MHLLFNQLNKSQRDINYDTVADEEIIQYLEKNKSIHSIEKLKRGLVKQGVEEEEVNKAIEVLREREKEKNEYLEKEDMPVSSGSFDKKRKDYNKKDISSYPNPLFELFKIKDKEKLVYYNVFSYGAISFVFMNIIVMVFRSFSTNIVYPKVVGDAGFFSNLALPDIFLPSMNIWTLFSGMFWSFVIGGVLVFLFFRYFLNIWPFHLLNKLIYKIFAFFLSIKIIFGLFINGFLSSLNPDLFSGYFVILLGMIIGAYAGAYFLVENLVRRNGDLLKDIIRKSI